MEQMWARVTNVSDAAVIATNQSKELVITARKNIKGDVFCGDFISFLAKPAQPRPNSAKWYALKPYVIGRSVRAQTVTQAAQDANPVAWKQARDAEQDSQPSH
jgi:hypothetical protein